MKTPDGMASLLASNYSVLRPQAPVADMTKKPVVAPAPAAAAQPKPEGVGINALTGATLDRGVVRPNQRVEGDPSASPFWNMKDGEHRDFRGFTADRTHGMTIVAGPSSPGGIIDNYLTRGYSMREAADALTARGGYLNNSAGGRLNNVRADLMPAESAAEVNKMRADAAYTDTQRVEFPKTAAVNRASIMAGTEGQRIANKTQSSPEPVTVQDAQAAYAMRMGLVRLPDGRYVFPNGAQVPSLSYGAYTLP